MVRHAESSFHAVALEPFARPRPRAILKLEPRTSLRSPSKKHSLITCAYLLAYLGFYLAVGFAGIAGIGWLWMSMLGK
ncbi:MAG: hypothetical protein ABSE45_14695 [Candidatus Acidiferrales bacterium]|jgi:hypothetical protein